MDTPIFFLHHPARREQGVVLIVGLVFLLVLTMLGISAMSINTLEERMAGNSRDLNLAFQAAESGLRDAELDIFNNIGPDSGFDAACTNGLCLPPSSSTPLAQSINWSDTSITRAYGAYTGVGPLELVSSQPRYIIEVLPALPVNPGQSIATGIKPASGGVAYRISALGVGGRSESRVILQSLFIKN
jgi:type IV pilus assembly protein PilX